MQVINIMKTFRADFTATVLVDGQVKDLTGYDVRFIMIDYKGIVKVNAPATISNASEGLVAYSPQEADVDTEGNFTAYFALSIGGINQIAAPTDKFIIKIVSDGL